MKTKSKGVAKARGDLKRYSTPKISSYGSLKDAVCGAAGGIGDTFTTRFA